MKIESLTTQDIINGLKHMADDHPCCKVFIMAAIEELERLDDIISIRDEEDES